MALRFMIEFVYPHAYEFYGRMLGRSASEDHATWIAEYVLVHGVTTLARRDIQKNYTALSDPAKRVSLTAALSVLETHGWLVPENHKPGTDPTKYTVNPAVHDGRFTIIQTREKARRAAVREAIAGEAARRRQSPTIADMRRQ
jgi:hypothetical protein